VLTTLPLLGNVCGLTLLGRVGSLVGSGVGSQGNCATLRPDNFFCHSCSHHLVSKK